MRCRDSTYQEPWKPASCQLKGARESILLTPHNHRDDSCLDWIEEVMTDGTCCAALECEVFIA
jgi:hypothetical protein